MGLLGEFPPVEFAYAYGSVAVPQAGYDASVSLQSFLLVEFDAGLYLCCD
jgi:hypothetical protein